MFWLIACCIRAINSITPYLTHIISPVPSLYSYLNSQLKPYVAPTVFKYPSDAGIAWPPLKKKTTFFGI